VRPDIIASARTIAAVPVSVNEPLNSARSWYAVLHHLEHHVCIKAVAAAPLGGAFGPRTRVMGFVSAARV
jgi:hypothetical protein